ncbi:inovirus Gp2 family protein [Aeromonas hydrophila]|nr:inovirus Gp2 family protein [Aeromonas hydrophila]HAT1511230.1 inovirus Gp2 family protein [Aeromonas hydrophila]HAT1520003.1 inovirus Gp2 family protein [Aeromonas hydrophila]HAT1524643.1 inovirus Gp2 family protein [Aeromonas hydrophila]
MFVEEQYLLSEVEKRDLLEVASKRFKSEIGSSYFQRCLDVVYSALQEWPRVFVLRVDLRFAEGFWGENNDSPKCFQNADVGAITRFIESLKSQLKENHRRKRCSGKPSLFKYVWVRERENSRYDHYHLVLFFNRDHYAHLGDYADRDAANMGTRIQKAWCSALGLPVEDYAHLVHFPSKPNAKLDRNIKNADPERYQEILIRIAYLCKTRTKANIFGLNSIGCSQTKLSLTKGSNMVIGDYRR